MTSDVSVLILDSMDGGADVVNHGRFDGSFLVCVSTVDTSGADAVNAASGGLLSSNTTSDAASYGRAKGACGREF